MGRIKPRKDCRYKTGTCQYCNEQILWSTKNAKNTPSSKWEQQRKRDIDKFKKEIINSDLLANLKNRKLREKIHKTSLSRGSSGGEFDNKESFLNLIKLRTQKANLLGFNNYAEYSLDEQTAKTVEAVNERLASLTPPSVRNANKEAIELQKIINTEDNNYNLESSDWDFYSEK